MLVCFVMLVVALILFAIANIISVNLEWYQESVIADFCGYSSVLIMIVNIYWFFAHVLGIH